MRGRLEKLGWPGGPVLDLAGGTGAAAAAMRDDGLAATAADLSRPMLLAARERTPALPTVCCDMRALPFAPASFALITSFYDSVNYLLDFDELRALLAGVGTALRPGGWFVFDLNTPYTLREHWTGLCNAVVEDDLVSIWNAEWIPERRVSSLRATFLVQGPDGRWDRFDEVHDEHGFTDSDVKRCVDAAGLRVHAVEDCHTHRRPNATSRRLLYFVGK